MLSPSPSVPSRSLSYGSITATVSDQPVDQASSSSTPSTSADIALYAQLSSSSSSSIYSSTDPHEITPQPSLPTTPTRRLSALTRDVSLADDDSPQKDSDATSVLVTPNSPSSSSDMNRNLRLGSVTLNGAPNNIAPPPLPTVKITPNHNHAPSHSHPPTDLHPHHDRVLAQSHSDPSKPTPLRPSASTLSLNNLQSASSATAHHALKTVLWVTIAALISVFIGVARGRETAFQFITAYIVEYSLSVDNLFVFLLIFRYFRVPRDAQETVLSYGILGAMLLRGIMIICGKELVNRFEWLGLLFAALLIYSAGKLLFEDDDDDADLDDNRIVRFAKAIFPVSERYTGDRFFVRENSRMLVTPLMVVLVTVELSDVVFAVDSVPAVLGLSKDTFVIYTSNIMAIMGLRSLFFVLSSSIGNLRFLKQALAIILGFIGIKMIAGCFGRDFSTAFSLCFVVGALVIGVLCSLMFPGQAQPRSPSSDGNGQGVANNV